MPKRLIRGFMNRITQRGRAADRPPSRDRLARADSLRVIVVYFVMGFAWILLSDRLLEVMAPDPQVYQRFQLYKGWFYIVASAFVFYLILLRNFRALRGSSETIRRDNERLERMVRDLTAARHELDREKEAQVVLGENLRQGRDLLDNLILNAPTFIMVVGTDGLVQQFNPFAEALTGFRAAEVIGLPVREALLPPEARAQAGARFADLMTGARVQAVEMPVLTKDGGALRLLLNHSVLYNGKGQILGVLVIGANITERQRMEERLLGLAYRDRLTGLPNLARLFDEGPSILRGAELAGRKAALCYLDLDNFKHINETLGHDTGDMMLRHLAGLLGAPPDARAVPYRLGGDDFVLLLSDLADTGEAGRIAESVLRRIGAPWRHDGKLFHASASAGLAFYPDHASTIQQLLQNADAALSHAKARGRNTLAVYDSAMRESSWNHLRLHGAVQEAIANGGFEMHYQPVVRMSTGRVESFEALIRLPDGRGGWIPPSEFIPFAENSGQIAPITAWTVQAVCSFKSRLHEEGIREVPITLNISGRLIMDGSAIELLDGMGAGAGGTCRGIDLEVTETAAVIAFDRSIAVLEKLKAMGFGILLDDFGTGYSSITYLRKLPVDKVKLDRGFLADIEASDRQKQVYRATVGLAHIMGLPVVAEGVETEAQKAFLEESGCEYAQGFLYGRPVPEKEARALLIRS